MDKQTNIKWLCKGCKLFAKRNGQIKFFYHFDNNLSDNRKKINKKTKG